MEIYFEGYAVNQSKKENWFKCPVADGQIVEFNQM